MKSILKLRVQSFYIFYIFADILVFSDTDPSNSPFILSFTSLQIFLYFLILTLQTVALLQCLYLTIFSKNSCSLPGKRKWQNMASLRIFSCMHILREGSLHIWEGGGVSSMGKYEFRLDWKCIDLFLRCMSIFVVCIRLEKMECTISPPPTFSTSAFAPGFG